MADDEWNKFANITDAELQNCNPEGLLHKITRVRVKIFLSKKLYVTFCFPFIIDAEQPMDCNKDGSRQK